MLSSTSPKTTLHIHTSSLTTSTPSISLTTTSTNSPPNTTIPTNYFYKPSFDDYHNKHPHSHSIKYLHIQDNWATTLLTNSPNSRLTTLSNTTRNPSLPKTKTNQCHTHHPLTELQNPHTTSQHHIHQTPQTLHT